MNGLQASHKGPQTIIQNDLKITKTNLYVKVDI